MLPTKRRTPFAPEIVLGEEGSSSGETFVAAERRKSMPARIVDLDRQTPMSLPYDMRDWVPAGHIVHFIRNAVEQVPITVLEWTSGRQIICSGFLSLRKIDDGCLACHLRKAASISL
jgi:hypothetical protein